MELLLPTAIPTSVFPTPSPHKSKTSNPLFSNTAGSFKTHFRSSNLSLIQTPRPLNPIQVSSNGLSSSASSKATTTSHFEPECTHWMVLIDKPPDGVSSKSDVIDFYVSTLAKVLGSEKDAQMCIYDASWQRNYGFCCDIDEETSRRLADLPGVVSVRPDTDFESAKKDYSFSNFLLGHLSKANGGANQLPSERSSKYWLVRMEKPGIEVVTKAQVVDYYAQTLTKVLGNETDAQMCLYDISWQNHFGFCCEIDEQCARELADVPGVLSVQPDLNYGSSNKDYGGGERLNDSSDTNQTPRTKRLFVTGLSFYTSEKTLRAAFEGFGELVEVKIIMDKISKRSKGYAFIEYMTEEAAAAALKEMNGKIINGWMIVVDVAKRNPPRHNRVRPGPTV